MMFSGIDKNNLIYDCAQNTRKEPTVNVKIQNALNFTFW